MSNSPIIELDQDYVILNTNVTVGKSYKSRGWALSRQDIHDWIPVEEFERDCKIIINNICADAILRFNPRLFYESDELSLYLKELYDKGLRRDKIPMDIKISKDNFFSNIDSIEKYLNLGHVDTKLLVGKSYSSKGWQLSKDVVSQLFPVENYMGEYLIYINDIESNAILNLQFRLFYRDDELSEYLEELHYKDARKKIPATIIFEHNSGHDEEAVQKDSEEISLDDKKVSKGNDSCCICGEEYDSTILFLEEYNKFQNTCSNCLKKIIALDNYIFIKDSSFSNYIKKEFVKEKINSNFDDIWELLIEYNFLTPFGDLYKLNGNELIEEGYSKYLSKDSDSGSSAKRRKNQDRIRELIEDEDDEEEYEEVNVCVVCGSLLNNSEIDKCEVCSDKSLAADYLRDFVTEVPYGKHFSKLNLISLGIDNLQVELMINKLVEYGLIIHESDIFYELNNVSFLNDFIEKYADSPYGLKINYLNDNNVLKISKKDLSSEERLDSLIKWKKYGDFVLFKKGQYGFLSVQFRQDGMFMYSKGYGTSYEAKIAAIYYLNSLGKIKLITDDEIRLEFK